MSLSPAQNATLKTDIQAQPSLAAAVTLHDWAAVANFYNAAASPAVNVWRADVKASEIVAAVVPTEWVALTSVQQSWLQWATNAGTLDASSANVRSGFTTLFGVGTTSRTNLTNIAQRAATVLEKLFGDGNTPLTSSLYGHVLTAAEVQTAMGA